MIDRNELHCAVRGIFDQNIPCVSVRIADAKVEYGDFLHLGGGEGGGPSVLAAVGGVDELLQRADLVLRGVYGKFMYILQSFYVHIHG